MNLEQVTLEKGWRYYKDHDGRKFPSVTTILGVALSKPALIPWAAKMERESILASVYRAYDAMTLESEEPVDIDGFMTLLDNQMIKEKAYQTELRRAGSIGTNVHKRIEWEFRKEIGAKVFSLTAPGLKTPEARRSYERFKEWREEMEIEILAIERQVCSVGLGYAGTLDTLVKSKGKKGVLDFKTGKRVYYEAFLQNCAYRHALSEGDKIKTKAGWIILLPKERDDESFSVVEVPPVDELIVPWVAAINLYNWQKEMRDVSCHNKGTG